tara:strand:+ start:1660 stop:2124 length:465 start_codon:yes stop_codon:yes gene_type:complete
MRDIEKIIRVNGLVGHEASGWKAKAEFRKANRNWLQRSAAISLKILSELQAKEITQAELARRMGITPQQITKFVKGQENLTLETISKIETALGVDLITVLGSQNKDEKGSHILIDNANISEMIEVVMDDIADNNIVRPLFNSNYSTESTLKYYE